MKSLFTLFALAGLACLGLAGASQVSAAPAAPPVPVEAFFATPNATTVRLSDDGKRVALLVRVDDGKNAIATLELATMKGGIVFKPNDYKIKYLFWKGDRIVFGGDAGGNESFSMRSIRYDGRDLRDLSESYKEFVDLEGPVGATMVSRLRSRPDEVLVQGYGALRNSEGAWEVAGEFGFYRLNIRTRNREFVEAYNEKALGYFTDPVTGAIFGRTLQDGAEQVIELKRNGDGAYESVARFPANEEPWEFVGLSADKSTAYLLVRGYQNYDRRCLMSFDMSTLKLGQLLYQSPEGELEEGSASLKRDELGTVVGVAYEAAKPVTVWFDPVWARMSASLEATFPGQSVDIIQSVAGARFHVVRVHSDRDPGNFFVFDATTPKLYPVGRIMPGIDPARMSPMTPISFVARDKETIHGYLTQPNDGKKTHPLVLHPHGGPFGIRDSWGFNPDVQFLASRGYAVLQVNYRGSGGYGNRFQAIGKYQWGKTMQDDLTDAVNWAVQQGYTTADRVAIYGASYGGYATLAGLVYTPELYRCGINYVGVSDLNILVNSGRDKGRGYKIFAKNWIGKDADDIKARSPINFVERIRVPSLHAYGDNDPRVDIKHWTALERELKKYGKTYQFIRQSDEGHGFASEANSIAFAQAVELFLAQNLKGPTPKVTVGPTKTVELPAKE